VAFGIGAAALGIKISEFLPPFSAVLLSRPELIFLGNGIRRAHYNLEPAGSCLRLGCWSPIHRCASLARPRNAGRVLHQDRHCVAGCRPAATLIAWAGPVAIVQAADCFAWRDLRRDLYRCVRLGSTDGWRPRWARRRRCASFGRHCRGRRGGGEKRGSLVAISLVVVWAIIIEFSCLPLVFRHGLVHRRRRAWIAV